MKQPDTQAMDFFEKVGYVFSLWNESWEAVKLNIWTFVAIYVLPTVALLILVPLYITPFLTNEVDKPVLTALSSLLAFVATVAVLFLYLLLVPATTITELESVKKRTITIGEALKQGMPFVWRFLLVAIIGGFIAIAPFIVSLFLSLIIIGLVLLPFTFAWIFVAGFFLFLTPFILVTKDCSAIDAIKHSFAITKQKWQWVLAVFIVISLLSLLGAIPVIGWALSIVATILYLCVPAIVYLRHVTEIQPKSTKGSSTKTAVTKATKKTVKKSSNK